MQVRFIEVSVTIITKMLLSQRVLCVRVFPRQIFSSLTFRSISSYSLLQAKSTGNNRGEKLLPPEERIGYLKAAEKRYLYRSKNYSLHMQLLD